MRRYWREPQPPSMFRGAERTRLLTGVVMLAVIFMLISRARDPNTWGWLTGDSGNQSPKLSAIAAANDKSGTGEKKEQGETAGEPKEKEAETPKPQQPSPAVATGPTDEDPDEAKEAAMELQAISDGTLELQREEMVPYDRIVRWVRNQPYEVLRRRARTDVVFTQMYQHPEKYRGQIIALDLNVRQVLDAGENDNGAHLWEVRAWTTESKAWLYWTVVVDLPKDMPVGPSVYEKAKFVGYFFKLQGYHEAGAKPNSPPLRAPLLIGRLEWEPVKAPQAGDDSSSEWVWGLGLLALLGLAVGLRLVYCAIRGKPAKKPATVAGPEAGESVPIESWLERPNFGGEDDGNNPTGVRD